MSDKETCKQCGGLLHVDWIMTFEQGRPYAVRWEPAHPQEKFCTGHSMMSDTEGWNKLDSDQKYAVDLFRKSAFAWMSTYSEGFHGEHPELRLSWSVTIDAMLRSEVKEPTEL